MCQGDQGQGYDNVVTLFLCVSHVRVAFHVQVLDENDSRPKHDVTNHRQSTDGPQLRQAFTIKLIELCNNLQQTVDFLPFNQLLNESLLGHWLL